MPRLYFPAIFLGMLLAPFVAASPQYDQETQNRNANCDNDCYSLSFPMNSCTDDPACNCNLQEYREKYFCCMAVRCEEGVVKDSVGRLGRDCELRNLPFAFDVEQVCGITRTSSTSSAPSSSSSAVSSSGSTSVSASVMTDPSSSGSQTSSGGAAQTSLGDSGATTEKAMLNGVVLLVTAYGALFLA